MTHHPAAQLDPPNDPQVRVAAEALIADLIRRRDWEREAEQRLDKRRADTVRAVRAVESLIETLSERDRDHLVPRLDRALGRSGTVPQSGQHNVTERSRRFRRLVTSTPGGTVSSHEIQAVMARIEPGLPARYASKSLQRLKKEGLVARIGPGLYRLVRRA